MRLDRRSRAYRRIKALVASYADALGVTLEALSPVKRQEVERAATLSVVASVAQESFLAGNSVSADDVVRACNLADRAVRRLGIKDAGPKPKTPTLADYLATRNTEEAAQ